MLRRLQSTEDKIRFMMHLREQTQSDRIFRCYGHGEGHKKGEASLAEVKATIAVYTMAL